MTTGSGLGPDIDNQATDIVTVLAVDPLLDYVLVPAGSPVGSAGASDPEPGEHAQRGPDSRHGASFTLNPSKAWLAGDGNNNIAPIMKGDLLMFMNTAGAPRFRPSRALDTTHAYFDRNSDDTFNFNQRNAAAGSITQILGTTLTVQRVWMYTYYVDPNNGTPRLMRQYNFNTPQALAGVVEDLQLSLRHRRRHGEPDGHRRPAATR